MARNEQIQSAPVVLVPGAGFGQLVKDLEDELRIYQNHKPLTVCHQFGSKLEAAKVCRDLALAYAAFADQYEREANHETIKMAEVN